MHRIKLSRLLLPVWIAIVFGAATLVVAVSRSTDAYSATIQPVIVDGGAPQEDIGPHDHDWANTGHTSENAPPVYGMKRWQEQICTKCGAKRFLEWPEHDCRRGKFDPTCEKK